MQLIGVTVGIALGRLLDKTDYGMIAMISVFALVANELQNSGFKAALNNIKQPQHRDYNSVFWFNICMGVTLYTLLFFLTPLIANYYHTPELIPLCRYAFLSLIFSSFGTAQSAYLAKNIMAKQVAKANLTSTIISSLVGVGMAWQATPIGLWQRKPTSTCCSTPYFIGIIRTGDPHSASIGNPLGECSSSAANCCSRLFSPISTTTL